MKTLFSMLISLLLLTQVATAQHKAKAVAPSKKTKLSGACDSLLKANRELLYVIDTTGKWYDRNISELKNLLAVRDSEIVLCFVNQTDLRKLSEEYCMREQQLSAEIETALKQQKRKIMQHKVLAQGFMLLSGIITTLYINAQH